MANIGVIGTGTWGTALARMLFNSGHEVTCWSALPAEIDELDATRRHKNLPGMVIPDGVQFTKDIGEAVRGRDLLLFAVPSVFVRSTARKAAPYLTGEPAGGTAADGAATAAAATASAVSPLIVDVAKGIEADTLMTMSEIIKDEIPTARVVALSGPTHAEEVALDLPTTIVSACADISLAEEVQNVFMNSCLRVYTNTDIKGVELCGALKNIIALAAGICAGLGYGDNAKAALITRGLAEMERLGMQMGCLHETFAGLAGMGDLIVTATSRHSRNNKCGYLIGQGRSPEEAVKEVGMVVEGINALPAAITLARKHGVEMPITFGVDQVINHGADPGEIVRGLMDRRKTTELFRAH